MALDDLYSFADDIKRSNDVATAMMKAHGTNPDQFAKLKSLEKITGKPANWMQEDPDLAAQAQEQVDLNGEKWKMLSSHSPVSSQWVAEGDNAKLASDDLDNLSLFEKATRTIGTEATIIGKQAHLNYKKGVGGMYQWMGDVLLQPLISAVATDDMKAKYGESNILTDWGKQMQSEANASQARINTANPIDPNSWGGAIRGGLTSTLQQLPTMLIGGAAFNTARTASAFALGTMGLTAGGQTYGEKRDAGLDPFHAGMAAAGTAIVEVATEKFPTDKLFDLLKPAAKMSLQTVFAKVGQIYGSEMVGESVATFMQDIIDKVTTRPDMTAKESIDAMSDYISSGEAWQNFKNTMKATLVQTTVMAGAGAGANRVQQKVQEYRQERITGENKALLDALTSAEASRLKERSPDTFAEFAQRAGQQHGVETVYLQSDRILEEAHKLGWNQNQLVEWASSYGVSQEDLTTAIQTNGTVELEFGKVAANIKTDEALTLFQNDLHVNPNTGSTAQAESVSQAESEHMVRLSELYQSEQNNLVTPEDIDQWKKDLLATPGLKGKVTDQHLDLVAATANTYSKLSGIPAIELANKMLGQGGIQAMKFKDFEASKQGYSAQQKKQINDLSQQIGEHKASILPIVEIAKASNKEHGSSKIGVVQDWIASAARNNGIDIGGYHHSIDSSSVRHIFKNHGKVEAEQKRGLIAVTEEDISMIPEIIAYPDKVIFGNKNKRGQDLIFYLKVMADGSTLYVEEVRTGKKELATASMRKYPATSRVETIVSTLNSTSENDGGNPNNRIIEPPTSVNSLFQSSDNPLGALSSVDGQNLVTLFEKADKSTFLHESGHIFLNFMRDMAENHGIQVDVWETTKSWLEVGEDGVITKDMHEKWAEHFEVYLMEGTAPTPTLKTAFRSFKNWLTKIYAGFTSSRAGQRANVNVTSEIRDIFDRILATEQEIQTAREQSALVAMLDSKLLNESGFTKEEISEYYRMAGLSEDTAKERMDTHKLAGHKERLAGYRDQATRDARSVPVYAMIEMVTDKDNPISINRDSVRDLMGDDFMQKLPNIARLWSSDGININQLIAEHGELFGYTTAVQFLSDVSSMQPLKLFIDKAVARLEAKHDASLDTEDAIRTSSLRKMLEIESRWLEQQAAKVQAKHSRQEEEYNTAWKEAEHKLSIAIAEGRKQAEIDDLKAESKAAKDKLAAAVREAKATHIPVKVMREWAESVIAKRGVKQFNSIQKLIFESRKHRQQSIALAKKGDWLGAFRSNEQARMTEELIAQTFKAKDQWRRIQKAWANIAKWTNDNKSVKIGEEYRDQINRLMSQYDIARKDFNPQAKDLHSFVSDMAIADESGLGTSLPAWLGVDVYPVQTMDWEEVNDLHNALKFLYGHGREIIEGQKTAQGEYIKDLESQMIESQDGLKGNKLTTMISDRNAFTKLMRNIQAKYRKFYANTAQLRFIAERIDGFSKIPKTAGKIVQRVLDGMAASNDRFIKLDALLQPHLRVLFGKSGKIFDLERPDTFSRYNMSWSRERVIAACLNMGTESSMDRLMHGYDLNEDQVKALQSSLTGEEWNAIQGVWKIIDSLWEDISETHNKINFFRPSKLQTMALTVTTADGQTLHIDGGYYPAKYDKSIDSDIAAWEQKHDILASSEALLQTPVAKSGFTEERKQGVKRPLDLSLKVLSEHLSETIKYINLAIPVRDADRAFGGKLLRFRNEETIGADMHNMIRPTLKHILTPDPNAYGIFESGRVKMSAYYMAYNAWTAIQNVTGVFPAIRHAGMTNYTNGLYHTLKGPLKSHKAMLELSPYMRLREANIERDLKKQTRSFNIDGIMIGGKQYTLEDVQSVGWAGIRFIDTVVSLPAWWGKYNAEMNHHGDMTKAVTAADTAVNKALGSGLAIDTTGIGRHKFFALLAPFMSFASTQQEVLASEREAWKEGKMTTTDFVYGQLMVWIFPAMASTFIQGALMYGLASAFGGGDERKRKSSMDYLTDLISYRLMGIPFIRDMFNWANQGFEKKAPVTSARMPVTEAWKMMGDLAYRVGNWAEEGTEKRTKAIAWSLAEMASLMSGIPASRIYQRWDKGTKQIESGTGNWANHFIPQEKKR